MCFLSMHACLYAGAYFVYATSDYLAMQTEIIWILRVDGD